MQSFKIISQHSNKLRHFVSLRCVSDGILHGHLGFIWDVIIHPYLISWWRHQMETFSALLAICAGNSPVPGEFPAQRPVTRRFDVFFDLRLNKRLSKQSWGWWFETLPRPFWRHSNVNGDFVKPLGHGWIIISHCLDVINYPCPDLSAGLANLCP